MTLEEFADNNCGINGGHDNPNPLVAALNPNPHPNPNPRPSPSPSPNPYQAGRICRPL